MSSPSSTNSPARSVTRWLLFLAWATIMALFSLADRSWIVAKLGFLLVWGEEGGLPQESLWISFHLLGSAPLGLLLSNALTCGAEFTPSRKVAFWGLVAALLYGSTLEALQHYIPSRMLTLADLLDNLAGITVGYAAGLALRGRRAAS